jgi:hypothetical protein
MPSWRTISATQKILTVTGFTVIAALLLYLLLGSRGGPTTDPPIIVGDGSITFHADTIQVNSTNELEVLKLLHKVKSVVVADLNHVPTSTPIDLSNGKVWTLTSASGAVVLTNDPQLLGAQEGVKGGCPTGWQGGGMDYTCYPTDGSKFTPATLTIMGGNCPITGQPTCTLTCANGPSGKCEIQLAYKFLISK